MNFGWLTSLIIVLCSIDYTLTNQDGICRRPLVEKEPCHNGTKTIKITTFVKENGHCVPFSTTTNVHCDSKKKHLCRCSAVGDPHYRTYDGQAIHFYGACKYTLTKFKSHNNRCNFNIEVQNEHRSGNKYFTYTKSVIIHMFGDTFELDQHHKLKVNGVSQQVPFEKGVNARVFRSNKYLQFVAPLCSVRVAFDGDSNAFVEVSKKYANHMSGICGNCNGRQDDFKTKSGQDVSHEKHKYSLIGDSYSVSTMDHKCKPAPHVSYEDVCGKDWIETIKARKFCGGILAANNPFKECAKNGHVDIRNFYNDCLIDMCVNKERPQRLKKVRCEILSGLAEVCSEAGFNGVKWRTAFKCNVKCGNNQHFSSKASPCPRTCENHFYGTTDPCYDLPEREGCECNEGYIRDGSLCVKPMHCKCISLCVDRENVNKCQKWMKEGQCKKFPEQMNVFCSRTCGFCKPKALLCEDELSTKKCLHFRNQGLCFHEFYRTICGLTCNYEKCSCGKDKSVVGDCDEMTNYQTTTHYRFVRDSQGRCAKVISQTYKPCKCHERKRHVGPCNHCTGKSSVTVYIKEVVGDKCIKRKEHHSKDCKRCPENARRTRECIDNHLLKITIHFHKLKGCFHCVADQRVKSRKIQCKNHKVVRYDKRTCLKHTKYIIKRAVDCKCHASIRTKTTVYCCNKKPVIWKPYCSHGKIIHRTVFYKFHNHGCVPKYKDRIEIIKCQSSPTNVPGPCKRYVHGYFHCKAFDVELINELGPNCKCVTRKRKHSRTCCCKKSKKYKTCNRKLGVVTTVEISYHLVNTKHFAYCKEKVEKSSVTVEFQEEFKTIKGKCQRNCLRKDKIIRKYRDGCQVKTGFVRNSFHTCCCNPNHWTNTKCEGNSIVKKIFHRKVEGDKCVDVLFSSHRQSVHCPEKVVTKSECIYPKYKRKITTVSFKLENCKCERIVHSVYEECPPDCDYKEFGTDIGECDRVTCLRTIYMFFQNEDCDNGTKTCFETCCCRLPNISHSYCDQTTGIGYTRIKWWDFNEDTKLCVSRSKQITNRVSCDKHRKIHKKCDEHRKNYRKIITIKQVLSRPTCKCRKVTLISWKLCRCPPKHLIKKQCRGGHFHIAEVFFFMNKIHTDCIPVEKTRVKEVFCSSAVIVGRKELITKCEYRVHYKRFKMVNCKCNPVEYFKIFYRCCDEKPRKEVKCWRNHYHVVLTTKFHVNRQRTKCLPFVHKRINVINCPRYVVVVKKKCRNCISWIFTKYYRVVNCKCVRVRITKRRVMCCCRPSVVVTKECKQNEIWTITAQMKLIGERCISYLSSTPKIIRCPHPIVKRGHCNHVTGLRSVTRKFYVIQKCKCHRRIAHHTVACPCFQKDRERKGPCDSHCKSTIKIFRYKRIGQSCGWSLIKSFWENCCCPKTKSVTDCVNDRAYRTKTTRYHMALVFRGVQLHRCRKIVNVNYKVVECNKGYRERRCIHHRAYETRCVYKTLKCKCQKRCKMFITGPCRCKELNHCKHECIHNTKYSVCYKYKRGRRVCEKGRQEYPIHEVCPKPVTECKSCSIHKKHGLYRSCRTTYFNYRDCRCLEKRKYKLKLCRCDDDINSSTRCQHNTFVITTTSFFRKKNICIPWKKQHYRSFICNRPVISVQERKCSTVYTLTYYIKLKCRCFKRTIVRKNSKCCGGHSIVRQCQKDHWLLTKYNLKRQSSGMPLFREVSSKIMKMYCQVIKVSWVQHISCRKDFKVVSCNVQTDRLTTENHHFAIVSCACKHIVSRTHTGCVICPKDIVTRSSCGRRDETGQAYLKVTIKTWKILKNNKCKMFIKHRKEICKCPKPRHFKTCQYGKRIFRDIWYDKRSRPPCRPVVKIRTELVHCYNNGHKNKWILVGITRCRRPGELTFKFYKRHVFDSKACSCFKVSKKVPAGICCKPCTFRRQCRRNVIVHTRTCHVPKHIKCKKVETIRNQSIVCPPTRRLLVSLCESNVIVYHFTYYKAKKCRCLRSTKLLKITKPQDKKECVKNTWRITHIDYELRKGGLCVPKHPTIIIQHIMCPTFIRLVDKRINDCKFRRSYYGLRPRHCKCANVLIRSIILNYKCCVKDIVRKTCVHNNIIVTTRIHHHLLDFRCHAVQTVRKMTKSCRTIPPKRVITGTCTYNIIHYAPVQRHCQCHRKVSFVEKKENCCNHKKPHTNHKCDVKTGRKITIYTTYYHTKDDTCVKNTKVLSIPVHCHRMRCEKTSTQCIHNTKTVKMFCFVRKGCHCIRKKVKQLKHCCGSEFHWIKKGSCDEHRKYFQRIQYFAMKLNPVTKLCDASVVKVQYVRCRCPPPRRRKTCLKNIYKKVIDISFVLKGHSCTLVRHEKIHLISTCPRKQTVKISETCNRKTGWSTIVYETIHPENCKCRRKQFKRKKICICKIAFPTHGKKKYCKDDHIVVEETMKAHCTDTQVDWRSCIKTIPILGCNKKYIEKGTCFRARNGYATHIKYDTHIQYFLKNCVCQRKIIKKVLKHCTCRKFHQTKRCVRSKVIVTSYSYFVSHGSCRQVKHRAKYPIKCPLQPVITKSKCLRNWYVITQRKFFINHCRCHSRVSRKRCNCICPEDSKYKICSKHYHIIVITINYLMKHCQCVKKVHIEEHNPVCPHYKKVTKGPCIPGKIAMYRVITIRHRKRRFHTCKCSIVERRKRKICACSKSPIMRNYCQHNSIITERWMWIINRKLNKCVKVLKLSSFMHTVCPPKTSKKICNKETGVEKEITVKYHLKDCKCIKDVSVRRYRCRCDTKDVLVKEGRCSGHPSCKRVDIHRHEELRGEICLQIKTRKVKICCCPKMKTSKICKVNDIITTSMFYVFKHGVCERKETKSHKLIKCPLIIIKKVGHCRKDGYKKIIFYQDRPSHCRCIRVKIKEKQCRCRCPTNKIRYICHQRGRFSERIITKHRLLFCKCETRRQVDKLYIRCPQRESKRSQCLWKHGKNYAVIMTTDTRYSVNHHCKCKAHVKVSTKICRCKRNKITRVSCHSRRHLVVVTKAFTVLRGGECTRITIKKIRRVRCNSHWKLKGETRCLPRGFYGVKTLIYSKHVHDKCQCKEITHTRQCHCACSGPSFSLACIKNQIHHVMYNYKIIHCKCTKLVKSDHLVRILCRPRRPVFGKCFREKNRCVRNVVYYKLYHVNCKCHTRPVTKRIGCRTCKCSGHTRRKCDRRSNKIITKTTRCHVAINGWFVFNTETTVQQISCVAIKICKRLTKCHRKRWTQIFECVVPYVHNCHCRSRHVKTTYPCECKPLVKKIGTCDRKTCIRKIAYIKSHLIILKNEMKKCVDKIKIFKEKCCCPLKQTQKVSCINNHLIRTVDRYVFNHKKKSCIHICNKYDETPICRPSVKIIAGECNRSTCKISTRFFHKKLVDCVCRKTASTKVASCCCLRKDYVKRKCVGTAKWIIYHRFVFKNGKCREIIHQRKFPIRCPAPKIETLPCNSITRNQIIRTHLSKLENCRCHKKVIDKEVVCRCPSHTFKRKCDKSQGVIRNIYTSYRLDQMNHKCVKSIREENHQIKCYAKKEKQCSYCNIDHHHGQYKICTTTWERRFDCSCKVHSKWRYTLCKCDKSKSHTKCINNFFVTTKTYFVKEKSKKSLYNFICVKKHKVTRHIGPQLMCMAPHVTTGSCIKNYRIYIVKSFIRKFCTCIPTFKVHRVRCRCPAKKEISRQCIDDTKIRKVFRKYKLVCHKGAIPKCRCVWLDNTVDEDIKCPDDVFKEGCVNKKMFRTWTTYDVKNCACVSNTETDHHDDCTFSSCKDILPKHQCDRIKKLGKCRHSNVYLQFLCPVSCGYCEKCKLPAIEKYLTDCRCSTVAGKKICSRKVIIIEYELRNRKCHPIRQKAESICDCSTEVTKLSLCERSFQASGCSKREIKELCPYHCNPKCRHCEGEKVYKICVQDGEHKGRFEILRIKFFKIRGACVFVKTVTFEGSCPVCDRSEIKVVQDCFEGKRVVVTKYVDRLPDGACVNKEKKRTYSCEGCCTETEIKVGSCYSHGRSVSTVFWYNFRGFCRLERVTNNYSCNQRCAGIREVRTNCLYNKQMVIKTWYSDLMCIPHSFHEVVDCRSP